MMGSKNMYGYGKMDESTARYIVNKAMFYGSKTFFMPGVGDVAVGDRIAVVKPCGSVDEVFKFELNSFLPGVQ